jgi:hypothetical protein
MENLRSLDMMGNLMPPVGKYYAGPASSSKLLAGDQEQGSICG